MKKSIFYLFVLMFVGLNLSAQDEKCGMEAHMQEMMQDPEFARQWEIDQAKFRKAIAESINTSQRHGSMDPIVVPVAVHFPGGVESDRACLEALAQNQVDIVNLDFTAANGDANLWGPASAFYPGVVHGAANIQFCIATQDHPAGTDEDLVEGGPAVTIGYDFGGGNDADPAWAGYLNFLVKPIDGSTLGYSPLGGNLNAGSSVVINTYAFGSGAGCSDSGIQPGANSNLGRTTTHELGHFFNLLHTFQGDSCDDDDGIADTPNIDGNTFGCPPAGSVPGCDALPALTMSYMDYTDDNCMYMFTQGQIDVVEDWLSILEAQFKPNVTPVCVDIPEYIITNDTVTACNGLFYDSGGAANGTDPGNYQANENFTYTICPETTGQAIQLSFTQFETQNNVDILEIFNGTDALAATLGQWSGTDSPGTVVPTLTNTSGCLTVVFSSNGTINFPGWRANIQCIDPPAECQTIVSQLDSTIPMPNAEDVIQVCVGEEITLTGSADFSEPGGGLGAAYQWDLGDGRSISGQTATFSYDQPGSYIANLNVWDINTTVFPEGCKNDNTINQVINVSTTPSFGTTEDTVNPICFGDTSTVTALVTPTTYVNICTPPESNVTFLPDGTGDSYETAITVDCFEPDQVLEDVNQLLQVCMVIEHSYLGDLDIELIAPSGQIVLLQGQGGGSENLGIPWATGGIDGDSNNTTQGVGSQYCFSVDDTLPSLEDNVDFGTFPDGDGPDTYDDNFIPAGTYSSDESLAGLVGTLLNGEWRVRITDYLPADNGYIFSWTLEFDYTDLTTVGSFTPEIVSGAWVGDEPTIDAVNGDTITISPDDRGEYCYAYTVTDDFGCEYTDEICVNVLPELIHDEPIDLFICDPANSNPVFNLFQNRGIVLAPSPRPDTFVVTFHNTEPDAENDVGEIVNLNTYPGSDQEIIYIRFEYLDSNCYLIEPFQLNVLDVPEIFPVDDIPLCDGEVVDETATFDLEQQTLEILGAQSPSNFTLTYHSSPEDADLAQNSLSSPYNNITNPQPIFVRIESLVGGECYVASRNPVFNLVVTDQTEAADVQDLVECDATANGSLEATFNLDEQTPVILGTRDTSDYNITYHASEPDAENGVSPLSSLITGPSQIIFFRIVEVGASNCFGIGQFQLRVDPAPVTTVLDPLPACDDDGDGFAVFTLTDRDTQALAGQTGLTVSYHATEPEAEAGTPILGSSYTNAVANTSEQIWVRLTNTAASCHSIMPLDLVVNPLPDPQPASLAPECDDDTDGLQTFNLSTVAAQVIGAQTDMVVSYHETDADAQAGVSPLGNSYLTNTPDVDTIHIRLENTLTGCYAVSTLDLVVEPLPTISSLPPYPLCDINSPGDFVEDFDLSTLDFDIINGQNATVSYHFNEANALGNIDPLPTLYSSGTQTIYAALEDNVTGCRAVAPLELVVDPIPVTTVLDPLPACDDDGDGFAVFTLTDRDTQALAGQTGLTVSYHATEPEAEAGTPILGSSYTNAVANTSEQIWVRLTNTAASCHSIMPLDLVVNPLPDPQPASLAPECDDDTDGLQTFNLSTVAAQVIGAQTDMVVSYHETDADAQAGVSPLGNSYLTNTPDVDTIHIRLENTLTGCYAVSTLDLVVEPLPTISSLPPYPLCDINSPGDFVEDFDLSTLDFDIINGQNATVSYHFNEANALGNIDPLPTLYSSGTQTIYAALEDNVTGCRAVAPLELVVDPIPVTTVLDPLPACDDDGDGFAVFTLTDRDMQALAGQTGLTVSYHATDLEAEAGTPLIGPNYTNAVANTSEQIWVRLTNTAAGCHSIMPLDLVVNPLPDPQPASLAPECDDDTDGLQTFNLSTVAAQVIGAQTDMVVSYHETDADAQAGVSPLGNSYLTNTPDVDTIHIRLENTLTGCYAVSTLDLVVEPLPTISSLPPYPLCDINSPGDFVEDFDLSTLDFDIINGQNATVSYHFNEANALGNIDPLPTLYSSGTQTIYAALEDNVTGCRAVAPLELVVDPIPVTTVLDPLPACDDDGDGFAVFTLTDRDMQALAGQTGLTVSYHATDLEAEAGTPLIGPNYTNAVANTSEQIWVRLTNTAAGCHSIMPLDLVVNPLPDPQPASLAPECDDDTDGLQTFNLSTVAAQVIGAQTDMVVSYHETDADAQAGVSPLGNSYLTNTPDVDTIHIRLENTLTGCYAVSTLDLVVEPLPELDLENNYVICADASTGGLDYVEVDSGLSASDFSFEWRDEFSTLLSTDAVYLIDQIGIYSLEVTSTTGSNCSTLAFFSVSESSSPSLTAQVTSEAFAGNHVIVATATGGGLYEYSLDQGPWQDSGTFTGVRPGERTVYVRDLNGCGPPIALVLTVIDYPPYFTPNGDGFNDTWNIEALSNQLASKIYIFDRFGKLLKQISPAGAGWDGTYNGQKMSTTDYWFLLQYNDLNTSEPKQLRGHFTLKR